MEKNNYSQDSSHTAPLSYPGPPEYVEQTFPTRPGNLPPLAPMQAHGMPMQPYAMGIPVYSSPNASYPPPIMHQPVDPYIAGQANLPPIIGLGSGDISQALGFLTTATKLQIRQKFEVMELITGFETENKYTILNEYNQPVFYAVERSDCCSRQCCGPARAMEVRIYDVFQNEVLRLDRPLACQMFCCFCCLQTMDISSPPQKIVANIKQLVSLWPKFNVNDRSGTPVLRIDGPFCTFSCGGDVKFSVKSIHDGGEIGSIYKKWSGFMAEAFTDADNFEVKFPQDLTVECKMALLGAVFLIDMMYYESAQNRR